MDRRALLAAVLGTTAIACVAAPFAVVGQRHAPKPAAPAIVTHSVPAPVVAVESAAPAPAPEPPPPAVHTFRVKDLASDPHVSIVSGTIGKHVFLTALGAAGLTAKECRRVLAGFSGVKNLDRLDADDGFTFARAADGHVIAFELLPSDVRDPATLDFFQEREEKPGDKLAAKRISLPIEKKTVKAGLVVADDLRATLAAAGLKEQAATMIDDALDGHAELSDLHAGARLRVVATEERIEGVFVGYAPLDAVELDPAGKPPVRVYGFVEKKTRGYFDAQGRQPYHGAWRSPVPMARISSRFDPHRMHPILHVITPHNGVDFAAPTGTPVYAAAAGTIRSAGDSGPCGNMVQIDHPNGLISAYCHLSRFGPIHPGEHVETRQLIGYVGQTGRATGPHLHFAVKRINSAGMEVFIDPLSMKLDGVRVVPPRLRGDFDQKRASLDAELDAIPLPEAPPAKEVAKSDTPETE
ncbi:MAG TPA: M23 family metallopeptidase [Polyangiaceae bacterium]